MAGGSSNYWEDLRKQARQLENELDLKLVSFSKLCTSYSSSRDGRRGDSNSDTTPLLNNSTQDRMFETMSVEIEQLLAKLTGVNDKMAEYTSTPGVTSLNAALMHTLQRHRDILQDYTHEFHKTKANFLAIREREDLLGSVRKDIETYKSGSGVNNRRTELFLKEHEHLRNSDRLMDDTISPPTDCCRRGGYWHRCFIKWICGPCSTSSCPAPLPVHPPHPPSLPVSSLLF
ncbi:Golgi SNAP receptor complex member 1 isoform X2 [Salmo salar]|uniref:Golgi SNAP receptor complex member 1 n=1 Tax=Salmo salar TaxID=8030 RepID=A0A1S3NSD2_SALSA|nr:Golgi SNAP receptor complex member 1 isoform X2 [Salmo salar]|eukprot:XP_014018165.1 PREDICTED: Golgi SNAP receptor complex member 1 isoform X2 [Salmo salar]